MIRNIDFQCNLGHTVTEILVINIWHNKKTVQVTAELAYEGDALLRL